MEMGSITSKIGSLMPGAGNGEIFMIILPFIISLIAAVVGVIFWIRLIKKKRAFC